ncbi:nucleotidyltransferase domain-containing protein [Candidatus Woesearchaeota archaeon]|nr:nucleotidyltransferase domain-containing protein [Candidatus Woesearchaeota archaeon]
MIHKSYFEIVEQFLGDFSKEVYGRELIGRVSLSQKSIALALNALEKDGILTSRKRGNMKFFKLNNQHGRIRDVLAMAEISRKTRFLEKHNMIANLFKNDERIVGIFGSYANGTEKKDSDLDVFIVGERIKEDYASKGRIYDLDVSVKYFSIEEFKELLKKKNPLIREISENHVLMFNSEQFISLLWMDFYGFD